MTTYRSSGNRRHFLNATAAVAGGISTMTLFPGKAGAAPAAMEDVWSVVGPRDGFTPHVGTIYSMLNMMRHQILQPVQGMTVVELDYLHDTNSNSIGALLWHMAATETYFQLNTFDNVKWGAWTEAVKKKWDVPMRLGEDARKNIKGHDLGFYLDLLQETRVKTVEEFRKRDDDWLMRIDPDWGWNNYAKWFHVAEHESNHNGQIKWLKGRLPGMKPGND
ncbi:MAG: DUF664 domain-containing protein [Cyclobacteriaceae bacterium]